MQMENKFSAPSWNDPPQLGYTAVEPSSTKRNALNKRVPFSFEPQPDNASSRNIFINGMKSTEAKNTSSVILPPTVPISAPTACVPDDQTKESSSELDVSICDGEKLNFIIATLEKILSEHAEKSKKPYKDITHRIHLMETSWSVMTHQVKDRMYNLVKELDKGNADEALKIQCVLMVENVREVKHWMVGVKHIIEMERQKSQ